MLIHCASASNPTTADHIIFLFARNIWNAVQCWNDMHSRRQQSSRPSNTFAHFWHVISQLIFTFILTLTDSRSSICDYRQSPQSMAYLKQEKNGNKIRLGGQFYPWLLIKSINFARILSYNEWMRFLQREDAHVVYLLHECFQCGQISWTQ